MSNEIKFMFKGLEKKTIDFIEESEDGTRIDEEKLEAVLSAILADAKKSNKGNGHAARRFRVNTVSLEKSFLKMRQATPVK